MKITRAQTTRRITSTTLGSVSDRGRRHKSPKPETDPSREQYRRHLEVRFRTDTLFA